MVLVLDVFAKTYKAILGRRRLYPIFTILSCHSDSPGDPSQPLRPPPPIVS